MNRFSCTTDLYADLYAKWVDDKPGDLLKMGGITSRDVVLDLCGGSGVVAKEAAAITGLCTLIDLNPRCSDLRVINVTGAAEFADLTLRKQSFSLVVCRQALGYLNIKLAFMAVHRLLDSGGRFVFNNFVYPQAHTKTYRHGGRRYFEAAIVVGRKVIHLQASPTIGADLSIFHWHSDDEVRASLAPYFDVEVHRSAKSFRYLCTKR